MLSQLSIEDEGVFARLAQTEASLDDKSRALASRRRELSATVRRLEADSDALQQQFEEVAGEYEALKRKLAEQAAQADARSDSRSAPESSGGEAAPAGSAPSPPPIGGSGMACPVAGAVSFVDSWGAPRDGHVHRGVDMMAAAGTPVVAIVSGTISLSEYGESSGNWIVLSGSDGNAYWYMHNQENLVSGGSVSAGQQIARVGDTGNAAGTPHLHFEYHPGGGAATNPYPLVSSIC
jgi:murein DD-endopeptidase MepM/ murein hydrolase activator NlpD